jgi:hypothetical protein
MGGQLMLLQVADAKLRYDGPWLHEDARLKTLYRKEAGVRQANPGRYYGSLDEALSALSIDHRHLLDVVWKIRSAETLAASIMGKTGCPKTRLIAASLSEGQFTDLLEEIEDLLARKVEAEQWLLMSGGGS